jgi:hypothetical protein
MMNIPVYGRCIRETGMPTSGIVYVAIGLILTFAVTSALSSAATEGIARFLGLRAEFLLRGLHELLDAGRVSADLSRRDVNYETLRNILYDEPAADSDSLPTSLTSALLASPILHNLTRADVRLTLRPAHVPGGLPKLNASPKPPWRQYRRLPTYIPPTSFAEAVIDLMVPDAAGHTTMAVIQRNVNRLPASQVSFRSSMQALVKNAGDDTAVFSTSVERWFNNQMDRVSREYKRHVTKIAVAIGAVLVVLFNVNAIAIGRSLYSGNAGSTAVSSVAAKSPAELPIGWVTVTDCTEPAARCNWLDQRGIFSRHGGSGWEAALFLLGFLLTIVALIPGARFWYGLLTKLGLGL